MTGPDLAAETSGATPPPYLVGLQLAGRRVVVVGGGSVAQRRVAGLLEAGAEPTVIAPEVTTTVQAWVEEGVVAWQRRPFAGPTDLDGAWYAVAATDVPEVNAAVAAAAEQLRVFCVRADRGRAGTAVTAAVAGHGEVRVGVLGGGDPGRAVAVRDGIAAALRTGTLDVAARRGAPGEADGGTLRTGRVALVGAGPGDPELITVRGQRLLAEADVVVADRLAPQALLAGLGSQVEVVDAAKLPRGRSMSQETINEILVERARRGLRVVRLKGGDPHVFGRGSEEVDACVAAGVPVSVVPGVSSAVAGPGLAGIPLTERGVAQEVVIASGHLGPDDAGSMVDWAALARLRGTLVLLMAVDRLPAIVRVLTAEGRAADTPAAVVQDATLPTQRVLRSSLAALPELVAAEGVRPPAVIVIGAVARSVGDHPHRGVDG